jgi:hypothetical protein
MGRHSKDCLDLHGAHYRLRVQVPRHLRGLELMLEQIQLAARQHKFMAEQDNVCLFSVLYFAE